MLIVFYIFYISHLRMLPKHLQKRKTKRKEERERSCRSFPARVRNEPIVQNFHNRRRKAQLKPRGGSWRRTAKENVGNRHRKERDNESENSRNSGEEERIRWIWIGARPDTRIRYSRPMFPKLGPLQWPNNQPAVLLGSQNKAHT